MSYAVCDPQALVVVGAIAGHHGVRGWLKVHSFTDPVEELFVFENLFYRKSERVAGKDSSGKDWQPIKFDNTKISGRSWVVHAIGFDSREASAILTQSELAVPKDSFRSLQKGEFYWADLIGLRVVNSQGENLGRLVHMLETGANDVMVVEAEHAVRDRHGHSRQCLIPWIDGVIKDVDLEQKCIAVDWDDS